MRVSMYIISAFLKQNTTNLERWVQDKRFKIPKIAILILLKFLESQFFQLKFKKVREWKKMLLQIIAQGVL